MNLRDYQTWISEHWAKDAPALAGDYTALFTRAVLGLAEEAGEVVAEHKKPTYYGRPLDVEALQYELGDVLHYLVLIADLHGLDLEQIAALNVTKCRKRYGS